MTVLPPRAGDSTALTGQASYMYVRPNTTVVHHTVELSPTLLVDTDQDGRVLGIESLNGQVDVADLLRVITAGFAEIRRQLAYKTTWNGGQLLVADRWFPSSKSCSACGAVKTKLTLSERTFHCGSCDLVIDRDHNAARNLAALAAQYSPAGSGPVAGRGADQKTRASGQVAAKRQPGTASAGQTGTVPPQGGTTNPARTALEGNGTRNTAEPRAQLQTWCRVFAVGPPCPTPCDDCRRTSRDANRLSAEEPADV